MALGIDGAAHAGALDAGGATVAVLGCGTDIAYPRSHRGLYARILEHGLAVSEYPPGTAPAPWRFPARNRLIAALAQTVVIVEARVRSGALITADHALDLGRDVVAVPGCRGLVGLGGHQRPDQVGRRAGGGRGRPGRPGSASTHRRHRRRPPIRPPARCSRG